MEPPGVALPACMQTLSELQTRMEMRWWRKLQVHHGWFLLLLFFALLPFGVSYNVVLGVFAAIGLCLLVVKFHTVKTDKQIHLYVGLFLCIYVPMLLSLPDAINFMETFRKVLSFLVYFFIGIAIIELLKHETTRRYCLYAIGLLLTVWMLDALYQYISGHNLLGYPYHRHGGDESRRLTGIFYPRFRLGIMLAILSPVYFEFLRHCQKKISVAWILVIPLFCVVLLTGSRTSWVMLALSCVMYAVYFFSAGYHRALRIQSIVGGLALLAVVAAAVYVIKPSVVEHAQRFISARLQSIEYKPADSPRFNSIEQRVQIWETGLRVASDHWINGIGVRGYRHIDRKLYIENGTPVISDIARKSTHPHQLTLEILVETGILGLVGFGLFWIIFLKSIIHQLRESPQLDFIPWSLAVMVAIFPLNMHKSFYEHFSSALIWVLLATAIAVYPQDKKYGQA